MAYSLDKIKKWLEKKRDPMRVAKAMAQFYRDNKINPNNLPEGVKPQINAIHDEFAKIDEQIHEKHQKKLGKLLKEEGKIRKRLDEITQEARNLGNRQNQEKFKKARKYMKEEMAIIEEYLKNRDNSV